MAGSTAIDEAGDCGLPSDQRLGARLGSCDSGAFEYLGCDLLDLGELLVFTDRVESTCNTALLGPFTSVLSTGSLEVTAGYLVTVDNGLSVNTGGELALGVDPALLPP